MKIRQDPITGLYAREDGAICMPPSGTRFRKYRWTFGSKDPTGYRKVRYKGKLHRVHRIVCRAFHGLPPADKPEVDHIDRNRGNNSQLNLRYIDHKGNADNQAKVDRSIEVYGVRHCDDNKAYNKVYDGVHREERRAYRKVYNEVHREEQKAYGKAHYRAHLEDRKACDATYYKAHREEKKAYAEAHREEIRAYHKAYRERRKSEEPSGG